MESYGFPWPSMLECDKFPLDNDMCITSQSEKKKQPQENIKPPKISEKQMVGRSRNVVPSRTDTGDKSLDGMYNSNICTMCFNKMIYTCNI